MNRVIINYISCVFFLLSFQSHAISLGMNAHLFNMSDKDSKTAIDKLSDLNIKYVRLDMTWSIIEKSKGIYSVPERWDAVIKNINKKGIRPVIILDYINPIYDSKKPIDFISIKEYKNYVKFILKHFNNSVYYYEIWNEWDSKLGGGNDVGKVEDYEKLVKIISPLIKIANKNNFVIGGSFTSNSFDRHLGISDKDENNIFLQSDAAKFIDIYSIHPYVTYRKKPFDEYRYFLSQVIYTQKILKKSTNKKLKLFITEMGWSTADSGYAVSQKKQGEFLSNAICDSSKLGVSAFFIYDLRNDFSSNGADGNNSAAFGLYDFDWKEKKSVISLKKINCSK